MLKATPDRQSSSQETSGETEHGEKQLDIRKKIGELISTGTLEKSDAQALVHTMANHGEYRTAVAVAKKTGLKPEEIFSAIKNTQLQDRLLTTLFGSGLNFPETTAPLPESSDIAAQYAEQNFQQQKNQPKMKGWQKETLPI